MWRALSLSSFPSLSLKDQLNVVSDLSCKNCLQDEVRSDTFPESLSAKNAEQTPTLVCVCAEVRMHNTVKNSNAMCQNRHSNDTKFQSIDRNANVQKVWRCAGCDILAVSCEWAHDASGSSCFNQRNL